MMAFSLTPLTVSAKICVSLIIRMGIYRTTKLAISFQIYVNVQSNPNIVTTPTTTQHNLNTEVGLDTKMALQNPPPTTETQL